MRILAAAAVLMSILTVSALAEDFSFSADSMSGAMTEGRERAVLTGNAVVVSGGMRIEADKIVLYGNDFRFAECSGRVGVVDDERGLRLSTEKLFYDRRDKLSRLTGPSVMEDRRNKVVIKGDYIENDDLRKIAVVQINVRILKENLSCRAEFARYDREANTLELSGSPVVRRQKDDFRASTILVDLDTEDIVLVGAVSGTVAAGSTKEKEPADVPAKKPADVTTGGGAAP
jgi:lipopolysaccharide export system protein LptA